MANVRMSTLALGLTACLAFFLFPGLLSAQAPTFTVLYAFTGNADGANPSAATMVQDGRGNLYGTTMLGADVSCNQSLHPGCGTAFRLSAAGKLTALHTFEGGSLGLASSGVIRDAEGNLYGTAGGGLDYGLVFEVAPNGTYEELYNFAGGSDGNLPSGNLVGDADGNLYGTTLLGGGSADPLCPNGEGCGTVFELGPTGKYKVLYAFRNHSDGAEPNGLIRDKSGNIFGATLHGGKGCVPVSGCGTIFKLDPAGKKTVLHVFTGGKDGSTPAGNLVLDSAGNLYGTTSAGGDLKCPYDGGAGCGVVFKIDTRGVETVLHAFHGGSDGNVPVSVVLDVAGNLYGATQSGPHTNTCGTVFKLDTRGKLTNLHNLVGVPDGCGPVGALLLDAAGNLYGATALGGYLGNPEICLNGCGTVFKVKP
jgi:uncharacterized repeat protein (TIGR03803 family)